MDTKLVVVELVSAQLDVEQTVAVDKGSAVVECVVVQIVVE